MNCWAGGVAASPLPESGYEPVLCGHWRENSKVAMNRHPATRVGVAVNSSDGSPLRAVCGRPGGCDST